MKTQSLSEITIEAFITISLIALLGLLTALIYALLALLGNEPSNQAILTAQVQTPEVTGKNLTTTNPLLKDAKAAPKLKAAVKEAKTQIIAEVATKPLTKMTVQELRPLARERKIPNWRKLKKKELLFHLTV
jgi:hypothetical protein